MSPWFFALAFAVVAAPAAAEPWVFRGQLEDGAAPAEGRYALRLTLYGSEKSQVPLAGPLELLDVRLTQGRFAVDVDFGALPPQTEGWLEVAAKGERDADYTALDGRTAVALKVAACPASWALEGNALTNPAVNFVGTTDAQAFEIRVDNQTALRLEPRTDGPVVAAANVMAGNDNFVTAGKVGASIGGGRGNRARGGYDTIGGGLGNTAGVAEEVVFDSHASVGGGLGNDAVGALSSIGGGAHNVAMGAVSVVPGGGSNCAGGNYSFAAGFRAKVRPPAAGIEACSGFGPYPGGDGDAGTFVWADVSSVESFVSTGPNQFNIRAVGGVRLSDGTSQYFGAATRQMLNLYSDTYGLGVQNSTLYLRSNGGFAWFEGGNHANTANDPGGGELQMRLDGAGNLFTTGAVNPSSDRNLKTAFSAVDGLDVLARVLELPLSQWSYKASPGQRHLGPMAQDFHAAFGLGGDDKSIATVDADGVALAAIQGLHAKLEAENVALRARLAALEAKLEALATRLEPAHER